MADFFCQLIQRDFPPRPKASWARLIHHRYFIGAHPMVVAKRVANADRDIPARFANSATVYPCRTSECMARSEPEMGASRNPAIRPGGKDSWPRLGQHSASTSIASRKRCSQAHPSGSSTTESW
jgi:hypothetical protein